MDNFSLKIFPTCNNWQAYYVVQNCKNTIAIPMLLQGKLCIHTCQMLYILNEVSLIF